MITLMSFGHKFGNPPANFKFDVSFFVNPWRDKNIKEEKDKEKQKKMIFEFMESQEGIDVFVERVCSLLRFLHLMYPNENITAAFCCSAGEYRSPVITELVAKKFKDINIETEVIHSHNSKI